MIARTALYKHYDGEGALLYVGISLNPFLRFSRHLDDSDWAYDTTLTKITWFDTRNEALAAEKVSIASDSPLHNVNSQRVAPADKPKDEYFSPAEVANIFRVSTRMVKLLITEGSLRFVKFGVDTIRVPQSAIDEYIKEQE